MPNGRYNIWSSEDWVIMAMAVQFMFSLEEED